MSRINRDVKRFNEIGEKNRIDLKEFIKHKQLGKDIKIPIKKIELPEFVYNDKELGGIGYADGDGEPGEPSEPGDESAEHGHYEMNPEEFAQKLDEELGLTFEDKGNSVIEIKEGPYNEKRKSGPNSTLDTKHLFKQGLKRHMAMYVDEEYIKELLRTRGYGVEKVWSWTRNNSIPISKSRIQQLNTHIKNPTKYDSINDIKRTRRKVPPKKSFKNIQFRKEDEKYKSPEIIENPQDNAVVINIRDVSGSMRKTKRDLVERIMTPLDWYLQGKYDNIEFVYIAHDFDAWEVERDEFFGMESGGGTKISSAFKLLKNDVLSNYPWDSWNRFVFFAGDGENSTADTQNELIPLLDDIKTTRTSYIEVRPQKSSISRPNMVADKLKQKFGNNSEEYRIVTVESKKDIIPSIKQILDTTDKK